MSLTTSQLKKIFMKLLYENSEIVKLIDGKNIEYPDDLLGTYIFPQHKINFTEQETGSYIGLKIDYPSICNNELYKKYILVFLIVSHNGHLLLKGDNRVDLIGEQIIKMLNWNENIWFRLELKSDMEYVLDKNYYVREIAFESIASNSTFNGVKQN